MTLWLVEIIKPSRVSGWALVEFGYYRDHVKNGIEGRDLIKVKKVGSRCRKVPRKLGKIGGCNLYQKVHGYHDQVL